MNKKRILLLALLLALFVSIVTITSRNGLTAGYASPSTQATGFTITSPAQGALVPCGQPITVTWTGGSPSDMVNVVLIDVQAFQVYQGFGVELNTGSRVVTIGPGSCGRQSQFYVEDDPRTTWTYGPVFTVGNASPTPTPTPTPTPPQCGTASYNAVSDFSKTSNPNSPWSYGWESSLGGAFTLNAGERSPYQGLDTWEGPDGGGDFNFPLVSFNHTGATYDYASGVSQPANMLALHPSYTGKFSVLRWTAPTTGPFSVVGLFQGIDTRNTTTDVHVLHNSSTSLVSGNINGFGNQSPFNFTRDLTAGDTLDFVVGVGNGNYNADSTGLAVTITALPVFNIADGDVAGLITAINSANANGCPTTINLAHNGTYTLTAVADNGDPGYYQATGAAGLPYIRKPITINGNGATIQRSGTTGTPDFTVLAVLGVGPHNGNLSLNGVTVRGGTLGGLNLVYGTALVKNSTVTQNNGAGINNICGSLNMVNSTVSYNTSSNAYGGGGIFLWKFACAPDKPVANISFSTIFENQNTSGTTANGDPYGPGYAITAAFGNPGDVVVKNSILASPTRAFYPARACDGALPVSGGHNIVSDGSCGFSGPGDMININPLLGPLANNGGLTPTHAPLCHSPAIDAVPFADSTDLYGAAITTDQRGAIRPIGAASDIGSVEAGTTVSTTATVPGNAGPWNQSMNPTFDYGVHDNAPPVVINASSGIPFIAGSILRVTYVSGTVTGDGGGGYFDANGSTYPTNTYDSGNGRFPGFYMNPGPTVYGGELVGAFAHNGVIVGSPFPIGNGPKNLTIPVGATELVMGINDNFYGDNGGAFLMSVAAGQTETLPTISCPAPLAASADVNCQAHIPDVLSDVTASGSCGGPVTLSQSPAAGTLVGLGTTTITVTTTDGSNNSSTCTTTFTVTDQTPPTITINTPSNGAAYLLNQSVAASYNCADCGGVASCDGPVASGSNIDTASVGMKSFTVSASDNAGNTASGSLNYLITYGVRVLFDQSKAAKSGSTIPIKVQLVDANGNNVSSSAVGVHAASVIQVSSSASVFLDDAGQANPDFDFRYDSTLGGTGGYIFNLKTTGYGTGTYVLNYTVAGDPVTHTVQFQVRQ